MTAHIRIGIDTGGTFTDVVAFDEATGELTVTKTPSTPADPAEGFMAGLEKMLALLGTGMDAVASVSHQALARRPEVFDQRHVAQHQARLRGHVPDQPLTGRGQRLPRRAGDPQRAEPFALVLHHEGPRDPIVPAAR
jgi:hypothetical protein